MSSASPQRPDASKGGMQAADVESRQWVQEGFRLSDAENASYAQQ
jgi:hypothetical protein